MALMTPGVTCFTDKNNGKELLALLTFCKENRMTTVFWNKEDPANLQLLLKSARAFRLHIFDRINTFTGNMNYKFPEQFQSDIIGELNYTDMIKAYKFYKVFLNVNSTKDSPTMFSRRVFELLASGTNVLP